MEIFCPVARLMTTYSAGHVSMNSLTRDLAPSSVPTQAQRWVPSASTLKMSNGESICFRQDQTTNRVPVVSAFSKLDVNANRELRRSQIFTSQQGAFSSKLPSNGFNFSRRTPTLSRLVASVGHIFLSNGKSLVSSSLSSIRWMLSRAKYA